MTTQSSARTATMTEPATAPIPCADCLYCKVFKDVSRSGRYILKVRCAKSLWRRGKDQRLVVSYDLHTLMNRQVPACPEYESVSEDEHDRERYLFDIEQDLPLERHVYESDGSFAELGEGL